MTKEEYTERFNKLVSEWKKATDDYLKEYEMVEKLDSYLSQLDKKYLREIKKLQEEYYD